MYRKDSTCIALIAVNIFSISAIAMGTFFKLAKEEGVTVGDFAIFRCLVTFLMTVPYLCITGRNPVKEISGFKCLVISRSVVGLINFVMFTWGLTFLPLSLATVLFSMAPFWATILGFLINGEPIIKFEYVSMFICFACIVGMTFSKNDSESFEESVDTEELDEAENGDGKMIFGIIEMFLCSWVMASIGILNRKLS